MISVFSTKILHRNQPRAIRHSSESTLNVPGRATGLRFEGVADESRRCRCGRREGEARNAWATLRSAGGGRSLPALERITNYPYVTGDSRRNRSREET
jgi:hypothetical protein